jgi:hypothetical protein
MLAGCLPETDISRRNRSEGDLTTFMLCWADGPSVVNCQFCNFTRGNPQQIHEFTETKGISGEMRVIAARRCKIGHEEPHVVVVNGKVNGQQLNSPCF